MVSGRVEGVTMRWWHGSIWVATFVVLWVLIGRAYFLHSAAEPRFTPTPALAAVGHIIESAGGGFLWAGLVTAAFAVLLVPQPRPYTGPGSVNGTIVAKRSTSDELALELRVQSEPLLRRLPVLQLPFLRAIARVLTPRRPPHSIVTWRCARPLPLDEETRELIWRLPLDGDVDDAILRKMKEDVRFGELETLDRVAEVWDLFSGFADDPRHVRIIGPTGTIKLRPGK